MVRYTLTATAARQIYVPRGFLHGFLALEDGTVFWYKQSAAYDPEWEFAVAWDDAELRIEWPLGRQAAMLSPRDAANPPFGAVSDVTNRSAWSNRQRNRSRGDVIP